MSILVTLSRGHDVAFKNLALLGVSLQGIESSSVIQIRKRQIATSRSMKKISAFFERDLSFHFEMEEECLFPRLETMVGVEKEFISDLRAEHEGLRKKIAMFQQITKSGLKDEETKKKLVRISREIIENLSAHARKEDDRLLPLARRVLDKGQLRDISQITKAIAKERG